MYLIGSASQNIYFLTLWHFDILLLYKQFMQRQQMFIHAIVNNTPVQTSSKLSFVIACTAFTPVNHKGTGQLHYVLSFLYKNLS